MVIFKSLASKKHTHDYQSPAGKKTGQERDCMINHGVSPRPRADSFSFRQSCIELPAALSPLLSASDREHVSPRSKDQSLSCYLQPQRCELLPDRYCCVETERPPRGGHLRNPIRHFDQAAACAFRFLRQPSRPNAPRPVAKRGSAVGRGSTVTPSGLPGMPPDQAGHHWRQQILGEILQPRAAR